MLPPVGGIIIADYFIDSTGDIILARDAGCEVSIGTEEKTLYNEPSAKVKDEQCINGVSYVFRIRKSKDAEHIDEYIPTDKAISRWENGEVVPDGEVSVVVAWVFTLSC